MDKQEEEVVGEAVRVEVDNSSGKVYLVFEIRNAKWKKDIITKWLDNIEFKIDGKVLKK